MPRARGRWTAFLLLVAALATATVATAQTTDLAVADLELDPAPGDLDPGENLTINATIEHRSGSASNYNVSFDVGALHIGNVSRSSDDFLLDDSQDVTAPDTWEATVGRHVVNVTVAPNNSANAQDLEDTDPSNDGREQVVLVGPDLVVESFSLTPEDPTEGQEVTVEALVKNVGPHQANGTFDATLTLDGSALSSSELSDLDGGATATVTATWTAQRGQHTLAAEVDPGDAIEEIDETNNTHDGATLDIEALDPDLAISQILTQPLFPAPGDDVVIQATVVNAGDGEAGASKARLSVDGSPLSDDAELGPLPADEDAAALWTWNATIGVHELSATSDVDEDVAEINETNNGAARTLLVGPDLHVTQLDLTPDDPAPGEEIHVDVALVNDGSKVDANVTVRVLVDGTPVSAKQVGTINANATRHASLGTFNATPGQHTVTVVLDPDDAVEEAREDNNEATATVDVPAGLPDLALLAAAPARHAIEPGDAVAFNATVTNLGANASTPTTARFLVDGDPLGDPVDVPVLDPGETTNVTGPSWTAAEGVHVLAVVVDPGGGEGDVRERDEANNRIEQPIRVGVDLVPVDLAVTPANAAPGENVTIEARVANQGSQSAGAFSVRIEAGATTVLDEAVDGLDPGAATTLNTTWTAAGNVETATLTVDPLDAVAELDEENNTRSVELTVDATKPNLAADNLEAAPASPGVGDNVTFTLTVSNDGDAAAPGFTVRFTVDGTTLDEVSVDGLEAGSTRTVESSAWTAGDGQANVTAAIDPAGEIDEVNEDDNEATLTVETVSDEQTLPAPGAWLALLLVGLAALARRRA